MKIQYKDKDLEIQEKIKINELLKDEIKNRRYTVI